MFILYTELIRLNGKFKGADACLNSERAVQYIHPEMVFVHYSFVLKENTIPALIMSCNCNVGNVKDFKDRRLEFTPTTIELSPAL